MQTEAGIRNLKKTDVIKILLAEDHKIVREGIRSLLEKEHDIEIAAEVSTGQAALFAIKQGSHVNVIVADINMPEMGGIELTEHLRDDPKAPKVLILSMLDHENYVVEAFNAGAAGYVLKNASREELSYAIRHVAHGGKFICNEIALNLLNKYVATAMREKNSENIHLTKREREILHLVAEGLTNNEIADKLFTSKRTVEGHRKNLLTKTNTKNTAMLIKFAIENGIIK